MSKLPLDTSSFTKLRTLDYVYVDKTEYAYNLISQGQRYFLARPRRFGKSLFISMLKELFKGNRVLFKDLWIDKADYAWETHGVIVLDFSSMGIRDMQSFNEGVCSRLREIAEEYALNIELQSTIPEIALRSLVKALYKKFRAVAILIDEYDNPILHALKYVDVATEIRDALKQFFSAIKALDDEIDFVFITGISSFAKSGVFSGMNNLQVITFEKECAAICGYTEDELESNLSGFIKDWAIEQDVLYEDLCIEIKKWYNGYRFSMSQQKVYNPFSLMHALKAHAFKNFWFLSGTPSFLVEMMKKESHLIDIEDFTNFEMSEANLGVIDVGAMPLIVLLYQAGYLTIVDYEVDGHFYKLDYPNIEVRVSFQKYLLEAFLHVDSTFVENMARRFRASLQRVDMFELKEVLLHLFSRIPYQLHMKEEKYYHSLLIMLCMASGVEVDSEYSTSDGRIDLILHLPKLIYVPEIKFNKSPAQAIAQIKERGYYKPFIARGKPIILLGLSFIREPHHFDIEIEQETFTL